MWAEGSGTDHSVAQPCVLLADDEMLVRDLVQESLQDAGYNVVAVSSWPDAFAALEALSDFVAVVTDINFGAPRRGGTWPCARGRAVPIYRSSR